MVSTTAIVVATQEELLHELARHAYELKPSDFSRAGNVNVYNIPVRSDTPVSFNGYAYTREEGVVRGLNLPQQLMLSQLLSERSGMPLRLLTLRENFDAAYSPEGQSYKSNVLVPFWVYTGEMIRKGLDDDNRDIYQVGRAKGAESVPAGVSSNHAVFEGETTQPSGLTVIRYSLGQVQQTELPTETGYFDEFNGAIPVNSEIKSRIGKGYWNGQHFDNDGLSAVGCLWG